MDYFRKKKENKVDQKDFDEDYSEPVCRTASLDLDWRQ